MQGDVAAALNLAVLRVNRVCDMIKITLTAEDYFVADSLSEIVADIENLDLLDRLYDGKDKIMSTAGDNYSATFEVVHEDIDGKEINVGDSVVWYDPDEEARDLERVYQVFDIESDELIRIADEYSEVEVPACELRVIR
jgi:hypothetical protein